MTYESVLKRLRRTYHGAAADWLIAHSGDRIEEYSGLIAEHLEGAGQGARAVGYLRQAGKAALARHANVEAERYLRRALAQDPPPAERADLLSELGEALFAQDRYSDAIQTWRAGIDLYRTRGDMDGVARLYARSARAAWLERMFRRGLAALPGGAGGGGRRAAQRAPGAAPARGGARLLLQRSAR